MNWQVCTIKYVLIAPIHGQVSGKIKDLKNYNQLFTNDEL